MLRNKILGYRAQERTRILIYVLTIGVLSVLLSSLQVSFFGRIKPFGAVPDLMICFVLCISYFCGKYAGAITGTGVGFLIEAVGSQGISFLPVIYMLYGYIVGHYAHAVFPKRYIPYLFYLLCGLLLRAVTTVAYACLTYREIQIPNILLHAALPEAIGTLIVGCILYLPLKLVCGKMEKIS